MPPASFTVGSGDLAATIGQAVVAAGRDDTLPALTGVHLGIEEGIATLMSTDRYRATWCTLPLQPVGGSPTAPVLIPAHQLAQLTRHLPAEIPVHLALGDALLGLYTESLQVTTRLLDAHSFPHLTTLWPTEFIATVTLETGVLADAVRRVAIVAERNTPVRLAFTGDQVHLSAGTGDEAQATEGLPVLSYEGTELEIAFNPHFLLDGLAASESKRVRLSFSSPTKPAVLDPVTEGDDDPHDPSGAAFRYLIMPVRLAG